VTDQYQFCDSSFWVTAERYGGANRRAELKETCHILRPTLLAAVSVFADPACASAPPTRTSGSFCELVNLNDATYTALQEGPDRDRLLQYEEYSWTAKFGVKANF